MLKYTLRRIRALIPVIIGVSLVSFFLVRLIPGDPARNILGELATDEAIAELNHSLGLDRPWYVQYFAYMANAMRGDFGMSIARRTPIGDEIWTRFAATAELTILAISIAVVVGVAIGMISARFQNTWFDYLMIVIALVGVSIPVFWLAAMGKLVFSLELQWLPSVGRTDLRDPVTPITHLFLLDTLIQGNLRQFKDVFMHLLMPAVVLSSVSTAVIARMTRSSMLEVMSMDFIRTATSKGLSTMVIVFKHGLKNAFVPILTIIGIQFGGLLGGAILTETIFGWPGIGTYIYDAIQARDYTVIQTGILLVSVVFVVINLIVDLLYAVIDPRIKY